MEFLDISYERLIYPIIEVSNYGTTWLTGQLFENITQ